MADRDELIVRARHAINQTKAKGHKLITGDWLVYNRDDGTFCGCALGLMLLHEKGEEIAIHAARVRYKGTAIEFFAEQLGLTTLEVEAFVAGFDDSNPKNGASEHEWEIHGAGDALRVYL